MKIVKKESLYRDALFACLRRIPSATVEAADEEGPGQRADLRVQVGLPGGTSRTLICEFKDSGQPRWARQAINQLWAYRDDPNTYCVFMAPVHLAESRGALCSRKCWFHRPRRQLPFEFRWYLHRTGGSTQSRSSAARAPVTLLTQRDPSASRVVIQTVQEVEDPTARRRSGCELRASVESKETTPRSRVDRGLTGRLVFEGARSATSRVGREL